MKTAKYAQIMEIINLLRFSIGADDKCITLNQVQILENIYLQADNKSSSIFKELQANRDSSGIISGQAV